MVAAQNGHLKIVEMLIASKANVNHQEKVSCLLFVCMTFSMHAALSV